jgi:photosystem II stability/assembly factor-like uncharacterized protein
MTTTKLHARPKRAAAPRRRRAPWVIGGLIVLAGVAAAGWLLLRPGSGPLQGGAISTLQTLDQHALVFSPTEPNVVFFGHHNGIMRSDDGGRSWKPLVDRRGFDAMQLATAGQSNPGRMYLAGHDVFQASDDGGSTWRPVENNLPGTDIHQFALDPDHSDRLSAVIVGFGAFRSADAGRSWTKLPSQPPGDMTALASAGGEPELLYAGTASVGLLRTADGGRTWATVSGASAKDAGFRTILSIAVDPSNRQALYVGTDGGLAKSVDGGASWTALSYPGDNAVAVAVSPVTPHFVLAVATSPRRQGLVYRSEDGGQSWGGGT